jgi:hypothetical protein
MQMRLGYSGNSRETPLSQLPAPDALPEVVHKPQMEVLKIHMPRSVEVMPARNRGYYIFVYLLGYLLYLIFICIHLNGLQTHIITKVNHTTEVLAEIVVTFLFLTTRLTLSNQGIKLRAS